jgi:hypothetical protein
MVQEDQIFGAKLEGCNINLLVNETWVSYVKLKDSHLRTHQLSLPRKAGCYQGWTMVPAKFKYND